MIEISTLGFCGTLVLAFALGVCFGIVILSFVMSRICDFCGDMEADGGRED